MQALWYFTVYPFERDGRFYKRLGVTHFKRFASSGDFWNRKRRHTHPEFKIVKNYASAIDWDERTKFNELAHLFNLLFSIIMLVWLYVQGRHRFIIPIILLTILLNVYPILLQRYNRARIQRIRLLKQEQDNQSNDCIE